MSVSKTIQYPAQTGKYKVFVKDKGVWQNHTHARLQISVGNPKHDGEKFFALAEWAAVRFDHVTLIVSDTLQKHNIALYNNLDLNTAHNLSLEQGNLWLSNNKDALGALPSKTITRWNDWLNHPEYALAYQTLLLLYSNEKYIQTTVREKAFEFSERRIRALEGVLSSDKIIETSVQYILEEVAAFAVMFTQTKAIDIYPGSWFKEIFEAIAQFSNDTSLEIFKSAECLRVDFIRNTNTQEPKIPNAELYQIAS